jgi:hypothetical protein
LDVTVRRAAVLGIAVFGIMLVQPFATADASLRLPKPTPLNLCSPGSDLINPGLPGPPLGTKILCKVHDSFQPGTDPGPDPVGPIPSEISGTDGHPGSTASTDTTGAPGVPTGAGSSAVTGESDSQSTKPAKKPPGQRLHVERTDSRSPLARLPWGPALLAVAFFVTVRRLARLT